MHRIFVDALWYCGSFRYNNTLLEGALRIPTVRRLNAAATPSRAHPYDIAAALFTPYQQVSLTSGTGNWYGVTAKTIMSNRTLIVGQIRDVFVITVCACWAPCTKCVLLPRSVSRVQGGLLEGTLAAGCPEGLFLCRSAIFSIVQGVWNTQQHEGKLTNQTPDCIEHPTD